MKKQLLKYSFILFSFGAFAQVPSYVPANGLGSYYSFSGNADDAVNALNGTINGGSFVNDENGNSNSAFSFNGSSDFIDIPFDFFNGADQNNTSFRVKFKYSNIGTEEMGIWNKDGSWRELDIKIYPDHSISFSGAYPSYYFGIQSISNSILENVWYDVVFLIANNVGKIYINGVEQISYQVNNISNSTLSFSNQGSCGTNYGINRFGFRKWSCVPTRYFNGVIDEFGVWDRELSNQEILNIYNECTNPPTASITSSSNTTFCQGGSVNLEANSGTNFTYQWYRNGTLIPNATNISYSANQAGTYTVNINNGECSAVSNAIVVMVNPLPTVNFNALTPLVSRNANAINLSGTPNGGSFSGVGVSGNQFIPFNAGLGSKTLTYSYTDGNGCTNSATQSVIVYDTVACSVSDTLIMDVLLSVNPLTYNTLKAYPNPSNTTLFINTGNFTAMSNYSIRIDNSLGQQVYTTPINQQEFTIDVSTWSGYGTYFLHLIDGNGNSVEIKKIILQ